MLSTHRTPCRREGGQVVVFFALLIPVFFALAAVVIDVGNWYVHKRHLQTQVDAAVLAAGPQFVGCFFDPTAANAAIASRALAYAGDTARLGKIGPNAALSTTNLQLQEPNDVRVALNSATYWQKSDGNTPGTNGYGLDNKIDSPGEPCATKFLDAKATDDDAPLLWGLIPLTPSPKAHARVQLFDLVSANEMLPWAVPEIVPKAVVALFVNEDSGVVFQSQKLELADDPALPWSEWKTPFDPLNPLADNITFDGTNENTGVVILISKNEDDPSRSGPLLDICTQPGLVKCYSGATATSGLSFIQGYNGGDGGTLGTPIVRDVSLIPAVGCTAADLSAPYFTLDGGAGCTASINAVIDFGVTGTTNPELFDPSSGSPPTGNCVSVSASPGGDLNWSKNVPGGSLFTGTFNLPADSGRTVLSLIWRSGVKPPENEKKPANGKKPPPTQCDPLPQRPNSGTFNKVAAPYVGDTASGPVQYLKLTAQYASGSSVADANSIERNDPGNQFYSYQVTVGLPKPLLVGNYIAPPIPLRMASPSGSQNRAWDCDSGRTFEEEIQTGCKTKYLENFRDVDGDGDKEWNNIDCVGYNTQNLPPTTFDPNPRPDCVMTEPGDKTGQLRGGLKFRFEAPCTPNYWPDTQAEAKIFFGPDGGGYGNDPRYVTLIVTDDTAFGTNGADPYPLKYYAGFYVTGWDLENPNSPGPQTTKGCPDPDNGGPLKGNDCHPIYGCPPYGAGQNWNIDNGDVWGYFVNIVPFAASGDAGLDPCDFGGSPEACVANLVE